MTPGAFVIHKVVYACLAIPAAIVLMSIVRRRDLQLTVALACFVFIGAVFSLGLADDSYISLRYARNFAEGRGLVFNVGERVEGYTCFLWVLMIGLVKKAFPAVNIVHLAKALGIVSGGLALALVYRFSGLCRQNSKERPIEECPIEASSLSARTGPPALDGAAFALLLVATDFPFVYWSFSGMETSFYTAILVGSAYLFVRYLVGGSGRSRSLVYSSLLLGVAALTRPETYLLVPVNLAFVLVSERRARLGAAALMLCPFLALFLPYFMWRYHYYGHLFPNTYYAKVGGGSLALSLWGLGYLARGAIPHAVLVGFIAARIARSRRRLRPADAYILSIIGMWIVTIVYTGADHFIELRYFVYLLPFMYLFVFADIEDFAARAGRWVSRVARGRRASAFGRSTIGLLAVVSFLAVFYFNGLGITATVLCGKHLGDRWGLLGRWLEENTASQDLVATPVVGAIGYYCDRPILDMVGIVDPVIAHSHRVRPGEGPKDHSLFDTEYVLGRKPKYIYLLSTAPNEQIFLKRPDPVTAIQDLKRFFPNPDYEYGVVEIEGNRFALYRRRS